ncbi:MAG: Ribonuclease VapC13 [Planctomycetes bacterium]|nr:Ribonuclease VapC13 [Planctomycetota bacterium]
MPASTACFLDANIVLYAAGGSHPLRDGCVALIRRAVARTVRLVTDAETLQEILHVLARRGRLGECPALVARTVVACSEVFAVTADDVLDACRLAEEVPGLSARDAIHAAVMPRHGVRRIASANTSFDRVPGLRRVGP